MPKSILDPRNDRKGKNKRVMKLRYEVLKKRNSNLHLHDLILTLKCLYPHRVVHNPYEEQIYYNKDWTKRQKELITQLVYASCLLNQTYRTWNQYEVLQANEEDFANALNLATSQLEMKRPSALLSCGTRRMLLEIMSVFGADPFTNRQVRRATLMSKSHVNRCLQDLISKGLARVIRYTQYKGYLYELTERNFKDL